MRCGATCSWKTVYLHQTRQVLRCDADQHAMLTGNHQHLSKPPTITYGPHRHVQHARPFASRTYYGDYGFDIPCITYSTWGYIVALPSNMLVEDSLLTQNTSDDTLRCLQPCHAHGQSSTFSEPANDNMRPAFSCTARSAACIANIVRRRRCLSTVHNILDMG